jgi:hypothetical protein
VRELVPEPVARIKAWRKEFVKPYDVPSIEALKRMSGAVDRLWTAHTDQLRDMRNRTTDSLDVFGRAPDAEAKQTAIRLKDSIFEREMLSREVRASSP